MENEGTRVILIFLVIFLASAIIGAGVLLIYFLVYKLTINKAVTAQSGGVKHKMPAPSSAAKTVIAVALTVLIVAVWIDIRSVKEEALNIYSGLVQQMQNLESKVGYLESMINSVSDELKSEKSIFTSVDISYGKPDVKNHSAKITVNAAPKSCTDEAEISIRMGDSSVKLAKIGTGMYSGEIEVDFYKEYNGTALIMVTDGGETVSEELDLNVYDIREKYGVEMSSHIESFICEYESGRLYMRFCILARDVDEDEEFFIRDSLKVAVEVEGNIVFEDSLLSLNSYSPDTVVFDIEKSCEIPKNANNDIISVSAVDKCGNTHICKVFSYNITEGTSFATDFEGTERVYDSTGNLIAEFSY